MLQLTDIRSLMYRPTMHLGVVFCSTELSTHGREIERLADCEVFEVAEAVKAALEAEGFQAELVDLGITPLEDLEKFDWVFNLAETIVGFPLTEYEVAERMEHLGIQFTGTGSSGLKACLDKGTTKAELVKAGILTPAFEVVPPGAEASGCLGFPLFVKPVHEDGSIGITGNSIVWAASELDSMVKRIHQLYHQAALVETYIDGRDITVSILGNGDEAVAFQPSECVYLRPDEFKIQTFDTKWVVGSEAYHASVGVCPIVIDPALEKRIQAIALQVYHLMGCRDYARVDFRVNDQAVYVLEVNPNPCINPVDTGYVRAAKAAGFSYNQLIARILNHSIRSRELVAETIFGW